MDKSKSLYSKCKDLTLGSHILPSAEDILRKFEDRFSSPSPEAKKNTEEMSHVHRPKNVVAKNPMQNERPKIVANQISKIGDQQRIDNSTIQLLEKNLFDSFEKIVTLENDKKKLESQLEAKKVELTERIRAENLTEEEIQYSQHYQNLKGKNALDLADQEAFLRSEFAKVLKRDLEQQRLEIEARLKVEIDNLESKIRENEDSVQEKMKCIDELKKLNNKLTYDLQKSVKLKKKFKLQLEASREALETTSRDFGNLNKRYTEALENNKIRIDVEESINASKLKVGQLKNEIAELEKIKSHTKNIVEDLQGKSKILRYENKNVLPIDSNDIFAKLEMFTLEGCEVNSTKVFLTGLMGSNVEFAEWAIRIAFELSTIANIPLTPRVYNSISSKMNVREKKQFFEFIEVLINKAYAAVGIGDARFQFTAMQSSIISLAMQKTQSIVNQLIKFQSFDTKQKSMRLIK